MKLGQVWKEARGRSLAEDADKLTGVYIKEEWNGYSNTAPITGEIAFDDPSNDVLIGTALYCVRVRGAGLVTAKIQVELPRDVVADVLVLLDRTEVEAREYQPIFTRSDDYPSFRVELKFESDVLVLRSTSQGKGRIPWEIERSRDKWVSDGEQIPEAMKILEKCLQRDVEKGLIEFAETIPVKRRLPP